MTPEDEPSKHLPRPAKAPDPDYNPYIPAPRGKRGFQVERYGDADLLHDPVPALVCARPPLAPPALADADLQSPDATEALLNGLIAECHYLMRDVALPTAVQVGDAMTRETFLRTAMSLAQTGAKVGRTIAKLRAAGVVTELRQTHVVEHVARSAALSPPPAAKKRAKT